MSSVLKFEKTEAFSEIEKEEIVRIRDFLYSSRRQITYRSVSHIAGYALLGPANANKVVSIHKNGGVYALFVDDRMIHESRTIYSLAFFLTNDLFPFLLAIGWCHLKHLNTERLQRYVPLSRRENVSPSMWVEKLKCCEDPEGGDEPQREG